MARTLVINLFGEPDAGKSRTAAYLFSALKAKGYKCELVMEVAKDLFYEESPKINFQLAVTAEQAWRVERLIGKVDIIITDSPVFLSAVYNKDNWTDDCFDRLVLDLHYRHKRLNVFIERKHEYSQNGRWHTEDEAAEINALLKAAFIKHGIRMDLTIGSDMPEEDERKLLELISERVNL